MQIPSWAVTATSPFHRERVCRVYLTVVGAALLLMLLDTAVISHGHASLAGMLLLMLTLPWTPLLFSLMTSAGGTNEQVTAYGWSGWAITVAAAVVSAGINAVLLGYAARLRRRRVAAR
ncbi:SCO4225 family membrane protein [Streptomyces sp. NPDC020917]|uniref:SCO4225 family membrane protein n=1 Tax=Streptomyces sp. NPDC020917 TaxID=3365102 RepID=UPI0037B6B9FA